MAAEESRTEKSPSNGDTSKGAKANLQSSTDHVGARPAVNSAAWRDWAEGEPGCAAPAALPAPSALPCLNSNNCPLPTPSPGYKLRQSRAVLWGPIGQAQQSRVVADGQNEGVDCHGRAWALGDDGQTWEKKLGGVSASEARTAFALRRNIEAFASHYSRSNCGFLTLTPLDVGMTPKQFGEVWHLIRKNHLKWIKSYVRVLEPQKRGAPHYHLCVAVDFDMLPDLFDWEALQMAAEARKRGDLVEARRLTRRYAESAATRLRQCWAELREVCERYGLGRSEFLPFRKGKEAIANYVGKYLEGGLEFRQASWKGARRVEYDRKESKQWRSCGVRFGWVSPGAKEWRARCAEFGRAARAESSEEMVKKFGPKWAYHLRPAIMQTNVFQWYDFVGYVSDEYGGEHRLNPRPITVGGEVVADMSDVCSRHFADTGIESLRRVRSVSAALANEILPLEKSLPGEEAALEASAKRADESGQGSYVIAAPAP